MAACANSAPRNAPSAAKVEVQVKTPAAFAIQDFDGATAQPPKPHSHKAQSNQSSATKTYEHTLNQRILPNQNFGRTKYQKYSDFKKRRNEVKRPTKADVLMFE